MSTSLKIIFSSLVILLTSNSNLMAEQTISPDQVQEITARVANYQLLNPHSRQMGDWIQGPFLAGLVAIGQLPGNEAYIDKAVHLSWQVGFRGKRSYWQGNDHASPSAWLELYEMKKDQRMLKPTIEEVEQYMAPKNFTDETMSFTRGNGYKWSWCDALYMSPPTFAQLHKITGEQKYLDFLHKWWWIASDYYYDQEEHLYFRDHTFFEKREPNGKKIFWGRGNGWVVGGLVRVLKNLAPNDPMRPKYEQQLREMCLKLIEIQTPEGLWRSSLLDPNQKGLPKSAEMSGSSFFVYGLAYAVNEGIIDTEKYTPIVKKAWKDLCSNVTEEGFLRNVQHVGDSPNPRRADFPLPYGTGAFLLAGSEVYRLAETASGKKMITFNDNGGWCWYQDERAIIKDGKLIVGSIADSIGTYGKLRNSNVELVSYDLDGNAPSSRFTLHKKLESNSDDHDVPALLTLPDGRVLAVYSKHSSDHKIRYRMSNKDGWDKEVVLPRKHAVCYSNVFQLSDEQGIIYDFYRGENFDPTYIVSEDNGQTWSESKRYIQTKGTRTRPYVKYASNNKDTIHFVTTEAHPQEWTGTSLYAGYIKGGAIYKSDGTLIQKLSDGPIKPEQLTKIYQGDANHEAWTIDLHLDAQGNPYTVYSVQHDKKTSDNRYRYARWNGKSWDDQALAHAGTHLYDGQWFYTGLAALDTQDPNHLFISTDANPETGTPLISGTDNHRHYELFEGHLKGSTWTWTPVTKDSVVDNLRPIMPIGKNAPLLWMRGTYETYQNFDTDIVGILNP